MQLLPVLALSLLALVGAVIGVAAATRVTGDRGRSQSARDRGQGLLRMTAEVHTGWEQTLIGLIRGLALPRRPDEVGYGQLYVEAQTEHRVLVRTRSEIGRGFIGAVDIEPTRGPTRVSYAILRLPGDEELQMRVLELELQIISVLRRIDHDVNVHLAADALRNFDSARQTVVEPVDPGERPER